MKKKHRPVRISTTGSGLIGLVPLTQGKFATIDVTEIEIVSQFTWHAVRRSDGFWARTYIHIGEKWENLSMPDLILGKPIPPLIWDHKDRDGLNNRKENLRLATYSQNMQNKGPSRHLFKGISFDRTNNCWLAQIQTNGRNTFLGYFQNPVDAAKAYDYEALRRYGSFAYINFP